MNYKIDHKPQCACHVATFIHLYGNDVYTSC